MICPICTSILESLKQGENEVKICFACLYLHNCQCVRIPCDCINKCSDSKRPSEGAERRLVPCLSASQSQEIKDDVEKLRKLTYHSDSLITELTEKVRKLDGFISKIYEQLKKIQEEK